MSEGKGENMKNIYVRITAWLAGPFSSKISKFTQNAYVMAIQNGFQTVLPMILPGSLAILSECLCNGNTKRLSDSIANDPGRIHC